MSINPKFTTAFSRNLQSNVLDHAFHITAKVQKNTFGLLSVVSRIIYLNMHQITNTNKSHILKTPSQCSREVSARSAHAQTQGNVGQK